MVITAQTESLAGWVVASEDVDLGDTCLRVSGAASLILLDGATLTVPRGITVIEDQSLTIYAQSRGSAMGALVINGVGADSAGIGGQFMDDVGNITIRRIHGYICAENGRSAKIKVYVK